VGAAYGAVRLLSVMLADEGTPDPDGAATDHDRLAYRHARYLCLPTGPISAAGAIT